MTDYQTKMAPLSLLSIWVKISQCNEDIIWSTWILYSLSN